MRVGEGVGQQAVLCCEEAGIGGVWNGQCDAMAERGNEDVAEEGVDGVDEGVTGGTVQEAK